MRVFQKLSIWAATWLSLFFTFSSCANTLFVDANGTNALLPFADWSTAATNIQDAIDAATAGDLILVTNGIYSTGGRSMDGIITNRVAVNKAVTVQSVNGPFFTTIQGNGPVNGASAIRCAWLTNNASLIGFTLKWGATRTSSSPSGCGGGVFGTSSNLCFVANCIVMSNAAVQYGSAVYQIGSYNSVVTGNFGTPYGSAYFSSLRNCTVVSNSAAGLYNSFATNCIIYYNASGNTGSSLSYCCVTPLAPGSGNFTNAPKLFYDGIHITIGSPCIAAGTNVATGTDIFGNAWANPPSVGCAEWQPGPIISFPQLSLMNDPVGFRITSAVDSQSQFTSSWIKDGAPLQDDTHFSGTQTTNLIATGVKPNDVGNYQLIVSNANGVITSAVASVVGHYVNAASTNALSPYSTWATAVTNIQDAITAANGNELVFVTNGIYASGGKSMDGVITNRVAIDKPIIVQSVNGPDSTTIQGLHDPAGNGSLAVRCAWMTNNAVLSGFTLAGGATRGNVVTSTAASYGGGVWSSSNSATLFNCTLISNSAFSSGGGAYQTKLISCLVMSNTAGTGGGAASSILRQCRIIGNVATVTASANYSCNLTNCAIFGNSCPTQGQASAITGNWLVNCTVENNVGYAGFSNGSGAAVQNASLINCIVYANTNSYNGTVFNSYACSFSYSDTAPLPTGTGNLAVDPLLLPDSIHLVTGSPCIGAGNNNVVFGNDIDGNPFANPPSMGCCEWVPQPIVNPQLTVRAIAPGRIGINLAVSGQPPLTYFWSQNGNVIQDGGAFTNTASSNLVINAANGVGTYQVIVSNNFGVATSAVAQIVVRCVDASNAFPAAPYTSWSTAATTIQDAIDIANPGDFIVVTNGLYNTGGRSADGVITNRITVNKPVTILSLNGYSDTTIQGAFDPTSPITSLFGGYGPLAIRCAWLTNGATLMGFTIQGGATGESGVDTVDSGGGVFCCSSSSFIANCVVISNRASSYGGAVAYGTVNNSFIGNNVAYTGAASFATLNSCTVFNNTLLSDAFPPFSPPGSGIYDSVAYNSIITGNFDLTGTTRNWNSDPSTKLFYCCTTPLPSGTGNINSATSGPIFTDLIHLAANCPCRGAGSPLYTTGVDIDGEPWSSPPSIGCDEIIDANLAGPLSVAILAWQGTNGVVTKTLPFNGMVNGRASQVRWSFGDGVLLTNANWSAFHAWTNPGTYNVNFTAYNTDNPTGVSTNLTVSIDPIYQPLLQYALSSNNTPQFTFPTQPSVSYRLLATTNLTPPVTWTTLSSLSFASGNIGQLSDNSATNFPARFYQIQAQ